jgi:xylulokinase
MTLNKETLSYKDMDALAATAPIGADGVSILPYGNGAERTLRDKNIGSSIHGLDFNRHGRAHILRAAQEGIVFALAYGIDIMRTMGLKVKTVRAGDANMFLSPIFRSAFATIANAEVQLYNTDGSQGAARGAGIGSGAYKNIASAFAGLKTTKTIEPDKKAAAQYKDAYQRWLAALNRAI